MISKLFQLRTSSPAGQYLQRKDARRAPVSLGCGRLNSSGAKHWLFQLSLKERIGHWPFWLKVLLRTLRPSRTRSSALLPADCLSGASIREPHAKLCCLHLYVRVFQAFPFTGAWLFPVCNTFWKGALRSAHVTRRDLALSVAQVRVLVLLMKVKSTFVFHAYRSSQYSLQQTNIMPGLLRVRFCLVSLRASSSQRAFAFHACRQRH